MWLIALAQKEGKNGQFNVLVACIEANFKVFQGVSCEVPINIETNNQINLVNNSASAMQFIR